MTCLVHTSRFTPVDGTDLGVFTLELVVRNVQVNFSEKSLSFFASKCHNRSLLADYQLFSLWHLLI